MSASESIRTQDLIVVVADADAKEAVEALLRRPESLQIRPVRFTVDRYVKRDSGCYGTAHEYLRPFIRQFDHAIVFFDRHGSGTETASRQDIERAVESRLERNGWKGRSAAIVCDPELEIWVWSDSPVVDEVLGWRGREPSLRSWLVSQGFCDAETSKPNDPKEAMKRALRCVRKGSSPSRFGALATRVGVGRCEDRAFLKLKRTLQSWFSSSGVP